MNSVLHYCPFNRCQVPSFGNWGSYFVYSAKYYSEARATTESSSTEPMLMTGETLISPSRTCLEWQFIIVAISWLWYYLPTLCECRTINDRSGLLVKRYLTGYIVRRTTKLSTWGIFKKIVLGKSLVAQNIELLNIFISQDFYPNFPRSVRRNSFRVTCSWILTWSRKFFPYQPRNLFAEQSKSQNSWSRLCGSRGCNDILIVPHGPECFFLRATWLLPRGISRLVSLGLVYWLWCWFAVFALRTE